MNIKINIKININIKIKIEIEIKMKLKIVKINIIMIIINDLTSKYNKKDCNLNIRSSNKKQINEEINKKI